MFDERDHVYGPEDDIKKVVASSFSFILHKKISFKKIKKRDGDLIFSSF